MTAVGLLSRTALAILWSSSALAQGVRIGPPVVRPGAQPSKPFVAVLPASDPGDSIRTILQRDLDYGDLVAPVAAPAEALLPLVPAAGAAPDFTLFAQYKPAYLVVPRRTGSQMHVAAYSAATRQVVAERDFEVPEVPQLRPDAIRDSVLRVFADRDTIARARLGVLALQRDSLLRAAKKKGRGTKGRAEAARRDSLLAGVARADSTLRAQVERNPVDRDSIVTLLIAADSAHRAAMIVAERMAVHGVADEVQQWLTGRRGIARSRIAYSFDGRLHVVDSDGANDHAVTQSGRALSPSWHPSGRSLVYSDLGDAGTQIAEVDIETGVTRFLEATPRGLNLTPVYTPDGEHILYANGREGSTQLVTIDRAGTAVTPFPGAIADASSPTFSPDGRKVAFIAPRAWSGRGQNARMTPQIFTVNVDNGMSEQLTPSTFGVRTYRTSPDWSPDGERVAYMQQHGDFQVWMIGVRDKKMRKLTTRAENEDPAWAPDSRHIAVASNRGGTKEIWILDVESGRARKLTSSPGARLPAWSPALSGPPRRY